jgi:8-oxo-dGTP pyrophosphatase MutT (NUDIX family)
VEPQSTREGFAGRLIRVEVESWDGHDFEVIRHPGAAAVLPLMPDGDVLLVRQFRPAIRRTLVEIPAGILDVDGEDALGCAARELFEETGYRHRSLEFVGGIYTSAGFADEYIHLFEAWTGDRQEGPPEEGSRCCAGRSTTWSPLRGPAGCATRRPRWRCSWPARDEPRGELPC